MLPTTLEAMVDPRRPNSIEQLTAIDLRKIRVIENFKEMNWILNQIFKDHN
jgi:hypothetical protein